MKNSRQVFLNKKTKRQYWVINDRTQAVMEQLQILARQAMIEQWDNEPLPDKTPFRISVVAYIKGWTAPDADGTINTIMDALQGVVFDNDRYCVEIHMRRELSTGLESVQIRVEAVE